MNLKKLINLEGKVFNGIKIGCYLGNKKWQCECHCGNKFIGDGWYLRNEKTNGCRECSKKIEERRILIDHTGIKIKDWTAIEYLGKEWWKCACDFGHIKNIKSLSLRNGNPLGCKKCYENGMNKKYIGKLFGRWELLEYLGRLDVNNYEKYFKCKCTCGQISKIKLSALKNGMTKGCFLCSRKDYIKPANVTAFNKIIRSYQNNAKRFNREWKLTDNDFLKIIMSNCAYTGLPPSSILKTKGGIYHYNSIDRVDSNKGYTLDNCLPCISMVNRMKSDFSYEEFIQMCSLITKHSQSNNGEQKFNNLKAV